MTLPMPASRRAGDGRGFDGGAGGGSIGRARGGHVRARRVLSASRSWRPRQEKGACSVEQAPGLPAAAAAASRLRRLGLESIASASRRPCRSRRRRRATRTAAGWSDHHRAGPGARRAPIGRDDDAVGAQFAEQLPLRLPRRPGPSAVVHQRDQQRTLRSAQIADHGRHLAERAGLGRTTPTPGKPLFRRCRVPVPLAGSSIGKFRPAGRGGKPGQVGHKSRRGDAVIVGEPAAVHQVTPASALTIGGHGP